MEIFENQKNCLTLRSVSLRRVRLRAVLYCVESDSAQANTAQIRIFREYLRENEFLSKTILACLSGAQMGSIHEIKKWQKISWHGPFKLGPKINFST